MNKQLGFTLIEIMIALVIGMIVIASTIGIYIATVKSSSDTIKSARLNYDVESALSLITNDIRRAGHWGGAVNGSDAKNNPFIVTSASVTGANFAPTDVTVLPYGGNANACILYSYDADGDSHYDGNSDGDLGDSADGTDDTNEFYGFRFSVSNGVGAIEMRKTGITTADCTNDDAEWEAITVTDGGERVNIISLSFDLTPSKCLNASQAALCSASTPTTGETVSISREVTVTLNAQLGTDSSVTKTMSNSIKIRNDRIYTQ